MMTATQTGCKTTPATFAALMAAVRREIVAAEIRRARSHDRAKLPALYAEARELANAMLRR